jgi:AraC-like DNA-binding protein
MLRIFLYSLIPWTMILLGFMGVYRFMLGKYENEITGRYEQVSQALIAELNLIFSGAAHTGYLLTNMPSFVELERQIPENSLFDNSMGQLIELKNLFSDMAIINDIVDSLFLYLPDANTVLYSAGTESADLYFTTTNNLADYPPEFWRLFKPGRSQYQLLNPTVRKAGTPQQRRVIPMIIPRRSSNLYIAILIRESFIIQILKNHHITANTAFMINTPDGSTAISSGPSLPAKTGFTDQYYGRWRQTEAAFMLGDQIFTLVTSYPHSDIVDLTTELRLVIIITTVMLALVNLVVSYILSKSLSRPVEGLIALMKDRAASITGNAEVEGIKALQQGVEDLLRNSEQLNINLDAMAPLAIENHMERLLLDSRTANPWQTMKRLKDYGIEFHNMVFQVALVKLSPSDELFSRLSTEDISLFYQGAMDLIAQGTPEGYRIWQAGMEEHTIRLLLNVPKDRSSEYIIPCFRSFISIFHNDPHLQFIAIGIGRHYEGVEQIHTSYSEARSSLDRVAAEQPNNVLLYTEASPHHEYFLPEQDSNRWYDSLLRGRYDQASTHLAEIITANKSAGITDEAMKKLIFRIYMLVQQVLQVRHLSERNLMGSRHVSISLQYNNQTPEQIYTYLLELVEALANAPVPQALSKIGKDDIEEYLEENFSRDISLDDLAERYCTTPVYVSKCFKKMFGIPLTSYLAEKRIAFASYLLVETPTLSIEEIAGICGYPNRIHFTRVFRQRRGVPPSEFRKQPETMAQ